MSVHGTSGVAMSSYRSRSCALLTGFGLVVGLTVTAVPAAQAATSSTGQRCTLVGTAGNDRLTGTARGDVICGLGGNDVISGGGGDDVLDGGTGNDVLAGGAGADVVVGGTGNDRMTGGIGDDTISAGDGDDTLSGDAGDDTLVGGGGADTELGGIGDDDLDGNAGDDNLTGGDGADALDGGDGSNACDSDDTDTAALACLYDETPPVVDRVEVLTSAVDAATAANTVRVRVHVTDDLSGVDMAMVYLGIGAYDGIPTAMGAAGVSGQLFQVSGTRRDSVWEARVLLDRAVLPGTWDVTGVQLGDWGGNELYLRTRTDIAAINAADAVTTFTVKNRYAKPPDLVAPVLRALVVTPSTVDITDKDAVITISVEATDVGYGVTSVEASAMRVDTNFSNLGVRLTRTTGAHYVGRLRLLANTEGGTYRVWVGAQDKASNQATALDQLITVTSEHPDVSAPVLRALRVTTPVVVKRSSLEYRLVATITDDSPGVAVCPQIGIVNPKGGTAGLAGSWDPVKRSSNGGRTLTCSYRGTIAPAAMAGAYRITNVLTEDRLGHQLLHVAHIDPDDGIAWLTPRVESPLLDPAPSFVVR